MLRTPLDIASLVNQATTERWCLRWGCTTCGSNEMKVTFASLLARNTPDEIAIALGRLETDFDQWVVEWMLIALSSQVRTTRLIELLGSTRAGLQLGRMLDAKKAANERRRAHDLRNDPDEILRYRNEKRQLKAEQHLRRIEEKKMRDEAYLAKRSTIEK